MLSFRKQLFSKSFTRNLNILSRKTVISKDSFENERLVVMAIKALSNDRQKTEGNKTYVQRSFNDIFKPVKHYFPKDSQWYGIKIVPTAAIESSSIIEKDGSKKIELSLIGQDNPANITHIFAAYGAVNITPDSGRGSTQFNFKFVPEIGIGKITNPRSKKLTPVKDATFLPLCNPKAKIKAFFKDQDYQVDANFEEGPRLSRTFIIPGGDIPVIYLFINPEFTNLSLEQLKVNLKEEKNKKIYDRQRSNCAHFVLNVFGVTEPNNSYGKTPQDAGVLLIKLIQNHDLHEQLLELVVKLGLHLHPLKMANRIIKDRKQSAANDESHKSSIKKIS